MANDIIFMDGFEFYTDFGDMSAMGYIQDGWSGQRGPSSTTRSGLFSEKSFYSNWGLGKSVDLILPQFTANKTIYFGFAMRLEDGSTSASWVEFRYNGTVHCSLVANSGLENAEVENEDGTITSFISEFANDEWQYHEFIVTIDDTDGYFLWKINGDVQVEQSGIKTKESSTDALINEIRLNPKCRSYFWLDDIYISNTQLYGDISIGYMLPNGAGSNGDWTASTGDAYNCVNDKPFGNNTDEHIESDTSGEVSTFSMSSISDIADTTDYHPIAARIGALGERENDTVSRSVSTVCLSNGTKKNSSAVDLSYDSQLFLQSEILQENPDGGIDWDWTSLNNAEFGVELES